MVQIRDIKGQHSWLKIKILRRANLPQYFINEPKSYLLILVESSNTFSRKCISKRVIR